MAHCRWDGFFLGIVALIDSGGSAQISFYEGNDRKSL